MGKVLYAIVILAMLGSAKCYNADLASSLAGVPIVGAMVSPPPGAPAYVNSIGTPAATKLPDTDPKKWFPADASADPYDPTMWAGIRDLLANAGTQAGWAEVCKKLSDAAGADRTTNAPLGALACSANPAVTALQPLAVTTLLLRAELALWVKAAPGSSIGAIEAQQGELRLLCTSDLLLRNGGPGGALGLACTKALDTAYLTGDAATTFTAAGEAYAAIATEIAKLDPKTAPQPVFYGDAPKP